MALDEPFAAYVAGQVPHLFFKDIGSNIIEIYFEENDWKFTNVSLISHAPKPQGVLSGSH